ncbi:MAG: hypothetical protein ACOCX4_05525 [Planctomycetota bacterium]
MADEDAFVERRQSPRFYRHEHAVVLRREGGGDEDLSSVQVMNISDHGVRFVSAVIFDPKDVLVFRLGDDKEYRTEVLECAARFNGYAVRARFLDMDA